MAPINRLKEGFAKLESKGCEIQDTAQQAKQAYDRQANQADQCLKERQEREWQSFIDRAASR